jgi:hypothetical protein
MIDMPDYVVYHECKSLFSCWSDLPLTDSGLDIETSVWSSSVPGTYTDDQST